MEQLKTLWRRIKNLFQGKQHKPEIAFGIIKQEDYEIIRLQTDWTAFNEDEALRFQRTEQDIMQQLIVNITEALKSEEHRHLFTFYTRQNLPGYGSQLSVRILIAKPNRKEDTDDKYRFVAN